MLWTGCLDGRPVRRFERDCHPFCLAWTFPSMPKKSLDKIKISRTNPCHGIYFPHFQSETLPKMPSPFGTKLNSIKPLRFVGDWLGGESVVIFPTPRWMDAQGSLDLPRNPPHHCQELSALLPSKAKKSSDENIPVVALP